MKRSFIIAFLVFTYMGAFAQKFKYTPKQDSAWVAYLLENLNEDLKKSKQKDLPLKREMRIGDTAVLHLEGWISGKVIYSPDSCLRIAQIIGKFPAYLHEMGFESVFDVTVQYLYKNKVIEQNLSSKDEAYHFQNYPIREIYKLPDTATPTYLIMSSQQKSEVFVEDKWLSDFFSRTKDFSREDLQAKNWITSVASLVAFGTNSLKEIRFIKDTDNDYFYPPVLENFKVGSSIEINSYLTEVQKAGPIPFLRFDPQSHELRFRAVYCGEDDPDCERPFSNVYEGVLGYVDSTFVLKTDSSYFYPPLSSFKKTVKTQTNKIGPFTVKTSMVETYEEVGDGVLQVLTSNYEIGNETIQAVNLLADEEDLNPEYRLQEDSSLIMLVASLTVPNHAGQCGMCSYIESDFWLFKNGSSRELFSFSSNSGSSIITYQYGPGKIKREGRFYLKSPNEDDGEAGLDKAYWKNNSTYVFRMANENLYRNFYIHFDSQNSTSRIEVGPLLKIKTSL